MAVQIAEVMKVMNELAPLRLQEAWDNPGLLIGDPRASAAKIMVTLDVTLENAAYAAENGIDLIISHHPVIFGGIKSIRTDTYDGALFSSLLTHKTAVYSAHTNLDSAFGGVNDVLAARLRLRDVTPLKTTDTEVMGRIGSLPQKTRACEFLEFMKKESALPVLPYAGDATKEIFRVALCGGAAASFLGDAAAAGADLYVTGDVKYHDAQNAVKQGILIADAGHYGSEIPVVYDLAKRLQQIGREKGWGAECIVDPTSKSFFSYY